MGGRGSGDPKRLFLLDADDGLDVGAHLLQRAAHDDHDDGCEQRTPIAL